MSGIVNAPHTQGGGVQITEPFHVLLVDDNELLLSCMKRYLERRFERVDGVCMGEEAFICLRSNGYHMAVVDIGLPGADGWEVLERIRQDSPKTRIVIITSQSGCEVRHEALERGASAFLEKPFGLRKLEAVLKRMPFIRQRSRRFCKRMEVKIGYSHKGITRDLSETGMFLECAAGFEPMMLVDLLLLPPDREPINLKGRIVRTVPAGPGDLDSPCGLDDVPPQPCGLGIELIEPPAAYPSLIAAL